MQFAFYVHDGRHHRQSIHDDLFVSIKLVHGSNFLQCVYRTSHTYVTETEQNYMVA